jgi:hypothetical protein
MYTFVDILDILNVCLSGKEVHLFFKTLRSWPSDDICGQILKLLDILVMLMMELQNAIL